MAKNTPRAETDPRHRNQVPEAATASRFLDWYSEELTRALAQVSRPQLERAVMLLRAAAADGRDIFIAGNGGSAAIADHLCCDWTKGTVADAQPTIRTRSMVSNTPLLTALANDFGYEKSFSKQLEMLARPGDVLIAISSSGNSANILEALQAAERLKMRTIAFTGFTGGEAAKLSDVSLHVPVSNYGLVEDCHQILMHTVAQHLAAIRDQASHSSPK